MKTKLTNRALKKDTHDSDVMGRCCDRGESFKSAFVFMKGEKMANIDHTTLWSDNSEKFDELTRNLEFKRGRSVDREPGKIHIRTAWGVPHDEIKELSKQHPDMTFYATHSFEADWYCNIYTVEYKNGADEVIKAEPGYMWEDVNETIKSSVPCYDVLQEKLLTIFKRLDIEKDNPENGKHIDWVDGEVCITVEHEGYRMKAIKTGYRVDILKVSKARKVETIEWGEINDDIPF